jgi:polyvinyl alcohol dehydrogenase (cytochrome)
MLKVSGALWLSLVPAIAQSPQTARLFDQACTSCHSETLGKGMPDATALRQMTPEVIYDALNKGDAHAQARQLSDADRRSIGEYLSGRNFMGSTAGDASVMPNVCASNPAIASLSSTPAWNGWGVDSTNGRFQPAKAAGIAADQVPRLKLKWAFGFPGATAVHGQPAVAAGRVFVGLNNGYVYALDAATGCVYWSFQARSGVRNAISIGEVKGQGTSKFAVYQDTPKVAWLVCGGVFGNTENCPEDIGPDPDYDFGAWPILRTLPKWTPRPGRRPEKQHRLGARSGSKWSSGVEGATAREAGAR